MIKERNQNFFMIFTWNNRHNELRKMLKLKLKILSAFLNLTLAKLKPD